MKLYIVPLAPNPTKVMLYIAERTALGADMGIEQVVVNTLKGRHKEPEHLARNRFGTLPVLERDDGSHLTESRSIISYLDERFPERRLGSDDIETRAVERDIEQVIDLRIFEPLGIYVHTVKSPVGYPPDPVKAAEIEERLPLPLDYVEELLSDGRDFVAGDAPTLGDCTLQSVMQFVRFIEVDVIGDRPHLRTWDERYRSRAELAEVIRW
ncbi:MAG: glutathione S-transferase family protein [Gammaproteobacteria bacterium AqS3]|nr:glutathione S-transferase family protein [Gammaproteobacteria bacterium AqS3]